jgi:hypothetical protein
MCFTLLGIMIDDKLPHPLNAEFFMAVTLGGITMLSKLLQFSNRL